MSKKPHSVNMSSKRVKQFALIAICSALAACGPKPPVVSVPPAEWTQPVEEPPVPAETTDESVADYIVGLIDALRASNNKLKRLDEWRAKVEPTS